MSVVFDRILIVVCVCVICGALLAGFSAFETLVFQALFRFLHFDSMHVFWMFFVAQLMELWITEGREWIMEN